MDLEPPGHCDTVGPEVACFKCPGDGRTVWPPDREWYHKHLLEYICELGLYDSDKSCRHVELVLCLRAAARAYLVGRINNH